MIHFSNITTIYLNTIFEKLEYAKHIEYKRLEKYQLLHNTKFLQKSPFSRCFMRDHGLRAVICISFRKGIPTTMKQMTKTDQLFTPLILLFFFPSSQQRFTHIVELM